MFLLESVVFGSIVGLALGLTGAGGATLAVPLLVYGLSIDPQHAVAISLLSVVTAASAGFWTRLRRREVDTHAGVLIAIGGIVGAPLGAWWGGRLPGTLLLTLFGLLVTVVSIRMWVVAGREGLAHTAVCAATKRLSWQCRSALSGAGVLTGLLSGIFGIGGGFVVVPAVLFATGTTMARAVGTSLMVVSAVSAEKTNECVVIDPTRDVEYFLDVAHDEGLRIGHVLETHVHADFVSGSRELKARLRDEPRIWCSGMGGRDWTPPYADEIVRQGTSLSVGSIRLEAIHTPGHTPEHVSWALFDETRSRETPWLLFTGDFVFVGDVGRPDLLGDEARRVLAHQLYESVFETLPAFPDFTEVFPGHGAGSLCGKAIGSRSASTLGFERRFNGSLAPAPEDRWVRTLLDGMPIAPPYFRRMKKINASGPPLVGLERPGQRRYSAAHVHQHVCEHCLIVDVRSKEAFAASHIPGAINIPLGDSLPTWAGWVLPYDHPTLVVADDPADLPQVVTHLLRVGFDDIRGSLEGGMDAWQNGGYDTERLKTMSVHDLGRRLSGVDPPFVLDVRTEREWNAGHIEGAHHVHGGLLQDRIEEVPRDREIAVICGTGYRASIAASFLKREGYERVTNVLGGMTAYVSAAASGMRPVVGCEV